VQIQSGAREFTEGAIECVVIGTAIAHDAKPGARGGQGGARAGAAAPVLTELSVPDYAKLLRAGFATLGVVAWTSVFFAQSWGAQQFRGGLGYMQNQELGQYTQGVYEAREAVMSRVSAQAASLRANGVVGMRVGHSIQPAGQNGMLMSFNAIGTAIREDAVVQVAPPMMTIDLMA
jgi:uncharacterized protein YbjQ (UPF0145 family)